MDQDQDLYEKYMAFLDIMLEEHEPFEVAAVMVAQGLSLYKTMLDEDEYNEMVDAISDKRDEIQSFQGPEIL
jgi:hypothetical protein